VDARLPSRRPQRFERRPMAAWFAVNMPDLDFDDIYYYIKPTGGAGPGLERPARRHQEHLREAGHPEAERKYLAGVTRSTRARWCSTATVRTSSPSVCSSATWTPRCASTQSSSASTSDDHPPNDNKFAALNSAVWSGGSFIYVPRAWSSTSRCRLLPHQRGEHGPVRAHLDHRRQGFPGALRGGVLGLRCTRLTPCTRPWSSWWRSRAPASRTPPSRTGRTTSTTW